MVLVVMGEGASMRIAIPLTCIGLIVLAAGCSSSNSNQPSLEEQGWTQLGSVTAKAEQDQSVLRAEALPGKYRSICIETNAPVIIERLGASFIDTSTFLADQQISFTAPGRQVIDMPGAERKLLHVMLVHSAGRAVLGTKITVWVR